jgi:hypothetical protein
VFSRIRCDINGRCAIINPPFGLNAKKVGFLNWAVAPEKKKYNAINPRQRIEFKDEKNFTIVNQLLISARFS